MNHRRLVGGLLDVSFCLTARINKNTLCVKSDCLHSIAHRRGFIRVCACVCMHRCVPVCVRACITGQAPWKQQQRSSAFKWIKTPAQSPEPAGIGQTGCSLDEDLRLIISHAAFVFAATVASVVRSGPYWRRGSGVSGWKPAVASRSASGFVARLQWETPRL